MLACCASRGAGKQVPQAIEVPILDRMRLGTAIRLLGKAVLLSALGSARPWVILGKRAEVVSDPAGTVPVGSVAYRSQSVIRNAARGGEGAVRRG